MTVPALSRSLRRRLARVLAAALLGVCAALLVSCSSSGKGLIPTGDAGPLQSDFEAVAQAAESGDGDCAATESALLKTEQDFARLPSSVDSGLHDRLQNGIENLRKRSLALCAQPLPQATDAQTTPKTTSTQTTPTTSTETQTTSTQTTPKTTTSTPSPSGPGGGTPAPGEETHVGEAEGGAPAGEGSGGARAGDGQGVGQGNGLGQGNGRALGNGRGQDGGGK
jgi:hypothetical protein